MAGRCSRRFNLSGAMALVAVIAFALVRDSEIQHRVAGWLAAILVICRLLPPRPSFARLIRQPGFVACVASLAPVVIVGVITYAIAAARILFTDRAVEYPPDLVLNPATQLIPDLVLASWVALALGARWSPQPSQVDRLGRAVGLYWLLSRPIGEIGAMLAEGWPLVVEAYQSLGAR